MTQPLDYSSPTSPQRFGRGLFGWILWVSLAVLLFVWLKQSNNATVALPFSTVYREIAKGNVSRIVLDGEEMTGTFRAPVANGATSVSTFRTSLPQGLGGSWGFVRFLTTNSTEFRVEPTNNIVANILLPLVPWLLILGFIWFFGLRQFRNRSPQSPMRVVVVNPEEK
jgi:ATP-dependent Zn protease